MTKRAFNLLLCLSVYLSAGAVLRAQTTSGTVRGVVLDPSASAIAGATVEIQNPVSHYNQSAKTDSQGNFVLNNVPFNNYHLTASAPRFQTGDQDIDLRSAIPLEVKFSLKIGAATTEVQVTAGADLVEQDPEIHTDVDRELFNKLPLESASSSLSSLVTLATPGVSADSNGLFHGLGDHAQNSFSIDGQPITDQQSKVFSNQLPVDAVQSMEVIEGAPPAEYGDKTSLVIVATTRSGLGQKTPHGDITTSFGSFGTVNGG
jgi:Carboxypeptidase regulatory-like domain/TonB-dependent Receptor Plug Domain